MSKEREYIKISYVHGGVERSQDIMMKEKHYITTFAKEHSDDKKTTIEIITCSEEEWDSKFWS